MTGLTRKQAIYFLKSMGYPITYRGFERLCDGPQADRIIRWRPMYDRESLIAWAAGRFGSAEPKKASELPSKYTISLSRQQLQEVDKIDGLLRINAPLSQIYLISQPLGWWSHDLRERAAEIGVNTREPSNDLPDDTPVYAIAFSTRLMNILFNNDLRSAGDVRHALRQGVLSNSPNCGKLSVREAERLAR